MMHPDFKYVHTAVNGAKNRKGVHDIRKLGNPTGLTDTYCTYFRYDEGMVEHYQQTGSVGGFTGKMWSDWLPIDIDSENLEEAQHNLSVLKQNLEDYEIDLNTCRFYFSGAKGFHVMIPSELFQAQPSADINKRFRKVALELSKGLNIDTSIYDKTRIFRLPNTINSKTGLYKIELYPFETNLSISEIKEKAQQPSDKLEVDDDFYPNQELTVLYHEDLNKPKKNTNSEKTKNKPCMQTLMQGIGEGERDNGGLRVASHLFQQGLSDTMVWAALDTWNESNDPPLYTEELERLFRQGKEYKQGFGCFDQMLKERCDPNCIFYKEEWGRF